MTTTVRAAIPALCLAAALAAATAPPASADESPAPAAGETVVLKAAHLFDATGTRLQDGAAIVVQGDHITSVGAAPVAPPFPKGRPNAPPLRLHRDDLPRPPIGGTYCPRR